jgi:hypothetical protein
MRALLASLCLATLLGGCCSKISPPKPPRVPVVSVDPTFRWTPTTTDCTQAPLAVDGYNLYAVDGGGPIPTVPTDPSEIPCGFLGLIDHAKARLLNTTGLIPSAACVGTPLVCSFHSDLPPGTYTAAVEAVVGANASGASNSLTFIVVQRPDAPRNLTVTR